MKTTSIVLCLIATLLLAAIFSLTFRSDPVSADALVQKDETPTSTPVTINIQSSTRIRRPTVLNGLTFGNGGGFLFFCGEQEAMYALGGEGSSTFPTGSSIPLELQGHLLVTAATPRICSTAAFNHVFATDADGNTGLPITSQDGLTDEYVVMLPLGAFRQAGLWRLEAINSDGHAFEISIDIQRGSRPYFVSTANQSLLGGFAPGERIKGVILGWNVETDIANELTVYDYRADESGFILFDATGPDVDIFVGESGEWVYANFELARFGVEHPTGQDISYAEGVTLFGEAFWAGGGQPEQPSVSSGPAQLRLDYATNSLTLTNVSGGNINMTGLSFSGGAGSWDILGWNTSSLGRPLDNFPNGNCLQLYPFGQDRPAIPSACNFSQGWITTGDSSAFFWRGDFSVLHNGSQVASCRSGDGVCTFRLNGSATSDSGSDSGTVSTSCPGAPPTAFQVGDTAIIDFNAGGALVLTFSPQGTGQDSDFIIEMFDNTELRILDGPICGRNGDRWRWQVEVVGRNLTGWASEGIRGDAWMCPVGNPECGS